MMKLNTHTCTLVVENKKIKSFSSAGVSAWLVWHRMSGKKKQYLKEDSERKEKKRVFSFLQSDGAVRKKIQRLQHKDRFFFLLNTIYFQDPWLNRSIAPVSPWQECRLAEWCCSFVALIFLIFFLQRLYHIAESLRYLFCKVPQKATLRHYDISP